MIPDLIRALKKVIDAVLIAQYGSSDFNYESHSNRFELGGCVFYIEQRRSNSRTVIIEGEKFRAPFNVGAIASHVLSRLSDKIEQRKRAEASYRASSEAHSISEYLRGSPFSVESDWNDPGKMVLTFRHHDKGTILAAIDHLQDLGYADATRAPVVGDVDECQTRHICRLLGAMPVEARACVSQFLSDLAGEEARSASRESQSSRQVSEGEI